MLTQRDMEVVFNALHIQDIFMNIIKTYKHISDNTGISKVRKYSRGESAAGKGQHSGVAMVMEQLCPLVVRWNYLCIITHDKNAQNTHTNIIAHE